MATRGDRCLALDKVKAVLPTPAAGQAPVLDLSQPKAIANLAQAQLVQEPNDKTPINEESLRWPFEAHNKVLRASTMVAKYELSEKCRKACDEALFWVKKFQRKYSRELRATRKILLKEKAAKMELRQLAQAQRDREIAEIPSQKSPEPEESDGEDDGDDDGVDSDGVDDDVDSDGDEDPESSIDIEGSESEGCAAPTWGDGKGGPDGGAKRIKKATAAGKRKATAMAAAPPPKSSLASATVPASPAHSDTSSATLTVGLATGDRYSSIVVGSFEGPPLWQVRAPGARGTPGRPPTDAPRKYLLY